MELAGHHIKHNHGRSIHELLLCIFLLIVTGKMCPQDAFARARHDLDSGDVRGAITFLESYRRVHVGEAEVYNLLGIAYARAGQDDRSLEMFKEFARLSPNQPQAYNNLGAAYLKMEKTQQAESAFRHALRLSPQDVNALYNLGALLNAAHEYSESRLLLERAFRHEPSAAVAYEYAVAVAGTGDRKKALQTLNSAKPPQDLDALPWLRLSGTLSLDEGDLGAASKALERAAALSPDDKESLYALALVRLKANEVELAIPLLDRVFDGLSPGERQVREGALLSSYGAYDQARKEFEQAASANSGSYDAFYNLAVLKLDHFKDVDGALEAARHALSLRATDEIHDLLGDICEAKGNYVDALKHYQEAVRLDPNNDKLAFDLGAELLIHANYDAARTVFQAAKERFPKASRIFIGLGTAEFMKGKTADAVGSFLTAVDLDPQYEPAYIFLGEAFSFSEARASEVATKLAYLARKRPESFAAQYYYGAALIKKLEDERDLADSRRALAALRRAADLQPENARVYFQLGELARLERKFPEAVSYYQKSIALDPNSPEPLYKLGQIYVRMGRQEDAKEIFTRHREAVSKQEAELDRREGEIQSFVLKIKSAP